MQPLLWQKKSIELDIPLENILHMPIRDLVRDDYSDKNLFADITLHELLMHISGLKGGIEEPYFKSRMMFFQKLEEFKPWVETFVKDKKSRKEQPEYSNAGFNLLGLAIEAITGKSYYDYVTKKVLLKANMINTVPKVEDANPVYAFCHTKKPIGLNLGGHFISIEEAIHVIENVKSLEKQSDVFMLLNNIQDLLKTVQQLQKNFYPRIEELSKNLELKLLKHPKDFLKIKQEYAIEVEKLCAELETRFPYIQDELEKNDRAVNELLESKKEWIEKNPDHPSTMNMLALRELFAHSNLPATVLWPLSTIESFINHFAIASAAGKWRSTVGDLTLFNQALFSSDGALADCASYLSANSVDLGPGEKYGYGTVIRGEGNMIAIGHTGNVSGGSSSCFYYPNQKYSVVSLVNDDESGLFMAFGGIEKHLVYGSEQSIIYLDEQLNLDGEGLLLTDLNSIQAQLEDPNPSIESKEEREITSTAKWAMLGVADLSAKCPLPEVAETKTNEISAKKKAQKPASLDEENAEGENYQRKLSS